VVNSFFETFELFVMCESVAEDGCEAHLGLQTQIMFGRQEVEGFVESYTRLSAVVVQTGLVEAHAEGHSKEDAEFGKLLRWAQLLYFSKEAEHMLAFLSMVAFGKPRQKNWSHILRDGSDVLARGVHANEFL
jgi:hypothetical protein